MKRSILSIIIVGAIIAFSAPEKEVKAKAIPKCFDKVEKGKTVRYCCEWAGSGVLCYRD